MSSSKQHPDPFDGKPAAQERALVVQPQANRRGRPRPAQDDSGQAEITLPVVRSARAQHRPEDIRVVVLIPVYKHSVLIVEAIESAIAQTLDQPFAVVIVNDGCPQPETDQICFALSQSLPNVTYLLKENGGPSSARNFGLDHVCETYPNLSAVFFLDADNRLTPDALAGAYELLEANPDVGWIYPHIATFEVEWSGDYAIPYSRLLHVVHDNLCDTGCLIRAELVRTLRFNPNARSGFEDWDFWLSAVAAGHRGLCSDKLGFDYRNRAESRFKEVSRNRSSVTTYLRDRYKKVFTARKLLAFEHEEAPRFAFFDIETLGVNFFTDPSRPWRRDNLQSFSRTYWAARQEPEKFLVPDITLWGSQQAMADLADVGLLHSTLWLIQRQLMRNQVVLVSITPSADEIDISYRDIDTHNLPSDRVAFIATRSEIVASCAEQPDQGWLASLASDAPGPLAIEIRIAAPIRPARTAMLTRSIVSAMVMTVTILANSPFRQGLDTRWNWRSRIFPARNEYPALLERHLGAETLLPLSQEPARANVGFVVPFGSFGGSEKVGYAFAAELRKQGFSTHLFVIGGKGYKIIPEFADAFDTVNMVGSDVPSLWGGSKSARGTEFGTAEDPDLQVPLMLGLLSSMDVVVNCQSAPLNAAIGDLRAQGIMTISYIHLFDRSPRERDVGHPFLGLMFEHAYDLFVTCSHNLRHQLHAMGIPAQKLATVENAPSFTIPASRLAAIRERRHAPSKSLKVLYFGRMDVQKGLERIVGIAESCQVAGLDISFRFIGSSIVEGSMSDAMRAALRRASITFEPPIFAADKLTDALADADAIILPSRWEGAPLVILEAQQAGCIPIATDVGAVHELIEHGSDGVLVPNNSDPEVVFSFVAALAKLQTDRELRKRLALSAMDRLSRVSWAASFRDLSQMLGKRFPSALDVRNESAADTAQASGLARQAKAG